MKRTFKKTLSLLLALIMVMSVFSASALVGSGAEIFTVSFDADGGVFPDGSSMYTVRAEYGSKLEVPDPTMEGYFFCGWYPYAPETVEDDATYYATWENIEYTITYVVDGEVYEEYPVWFGDEVDMPADPYFDDGRIFLGWSETEGSDELAEIPEFMPSENLVYYAVWEEIIEPEYNIIFDENGGSEVADVKCEAGEEIILPLTDRVGFIFLGWSDGETTYEAGSDFVMPEQDVVLTAVWEIDNTVTGICGDNLTWSLNTESGELVISGTGDMYDSEPSWLEYLSDIKSVIVEEGATSIGNYALYNCTGLTSISLPDGLTRIGDYAFYNCSALKSISIPGSVATIGEFAFSYAGLTSLTVPHGVKSIGESAFEMCTALKSVLISDTVTSIGFRAFRWCTDLKGITVDSANTAYSSDNYGVLFNKEKTKLIQYPLGNERTGYNIPASVTETDEHSFSACNSITDITIHGNIKTLGNGTFESCMGLETVTIKDGVLTIGNGAFASCESLENIAISDSVTSIGYDAFYGTGFYNNSSNWDNKVLYIGKYLIAVKNTIYGACTVKDETKVIADYAFSDCEKFEKITIPDSLTNIGNSAFYRCFSITDVYYNRSEDDWKKVAIGSNNECFTNATIHFTEGYYTYTVDENGNATITDVDEGIPGEVTVPETLGGHPVTAIGWMAFADCDSMTEVTISGNVTNIDGAAFVACDRLSSVVIGNSVTNMGGCAFDSCRRLTSVTIGENVKRIGEYTFYDCVSLTSIEIPDSVTEIGWNAFENCSGLKTVIIGDGVTTIDRLAFKECNAIEYVSLGSGISNIGKDAFSPCYSLEKADYNGTRADWESVTVESGNGTLELVLRCIDDVEETTTESTTAPEVTEPSTTEPTIAPVVTEPSTTEPTTTPEVTEPSTTEPTTAPEVTEPSTTEPTTAPEVTEPSTTEPTTAPEVTEPSTTEPTTAPEVTEPSTTEPTTAPEVTEPSTTEPTTAPVATEPSTTEPTTAPVMTEPSTTEPTTAPEVTEPSTTNPTVKPDVTVSINTPSITTVKYGDTLILHANIKGEIPEGAKLEWSVEGEGVTIKPSADGKTCAVTSTANGTVTVSVKLVDKNGNAVSNSSGNDITAEQELASKAGFFQKIISFFKNLFGMNRIIEQAFKFAF